MISQQRAGRRLFALSAIALFSAAAFGATPQVAMAPERTVLLKADGTVWQWGIVDFFGARSSPGANCHVVDSTTKAAPAQVGGLSGVLAVAATGRESIALKNDGTVWQWGVNTALLATCPSGSIARAPTKVADANGALSSVTAIWAQSGSFFARKADGSLWAWGNNELNKLGIVSPPQATNTPKPGADIQNIAVPRQVVHLKAAAGAWPPATPPLAVASGGTHTLALLYDGNVKAWGGAEYGERGTGAYGRSANPVWTGWAWMDWPAMTSISGVSSLSAGLYKSAAVRNDGSLWVWGCNQSGELGDGIPMGSHVSVLCERLPKQVSNLGGVAAVAMGDSHTTILKADGTVWGMGYNGSGALAADNSVERSLVPLRIPGLSGVTAIDAAKTCSVAIRNDGTVWEWGVYCNGPNYRPVPPEQINVGSVSATPLCGSANGRSFVAAPAANLCLVGSASAVSGAGPWQWNCGPFNGQSVACSATNGPVFVLNPSGIRTFPGGKVTLKAIAQGSGTLAYQWYKMAANGSKVQLTDRRGMNNQLSVFSGIAGSATAQLTISNIQAADGAAYFVEARDQNGVSARSQSAQVGVMVAVKPTRPELLR